MRGFIPAAGFGKRLLPITRDIPKPLVKVGDHPVISLVYEKLISAGVRSVGINFSHLALKGIDFARRELPPFLHIYRESTPIGAFGGVNNFIKNISSESLLVHNGDIFFDGEIGGIIGKSDITLVAVNNGKSDMILGDSGELLEIGFPESGETGLGYAGIVYFSSEAVDWLRGLYAANTYVSFIEDIVLPAKKHGFRVTGEVIDGFWSDIGTHEELKKVQKYLLNIDN